MVSKLKICSTLMRVMNVGDSGPVGVAMQGCEFGGALLVRNKVRKLLNQQRHRVKHHLDSVIEVLIFWPILQNFSCGWYLYWVTTIRRTAFAIHTYMYQNLDDL